MHNTVPKLIAYISEFVYRLIEFIDLLIGSKEKITRTLSFRRSWRKHLKEDSLRNDKKQTLWIHGASLGELEDISAFIDSDHPYQLVITASSISAEKRLQKWKKQENVLYAGPIPPEKKSECKSFLDTFNIDLFILSQSDLWPRLFLEAAQKKIKAIWLPHKTQSSQFLKKYFLEEWIQLVGLRTKDEIKILKNTQHSFIGNLRIDSIYNRIKKQKQHDNHILKSLEAEPRKNLFNIIVGSGWKEDAKFIRESIDSLSTKTSQLINIVFCPHETKNIEELTRIKSYLPKATIVEKEGILVEAYQNFHLAFVGGGFETGLHNVNEPALWSLPVVCGPDLRKQPDCHLLQKRGQLIPLKKVSDFKNLLEYMIHKEDALDDLQKKASISAKKLEESRGASVRLQDKITSLLKGELIL